MKVLHAYAETPRTVGQGLRGLVELRDWRLMGELSSAGGGKKEGEISRCC